MYNAMDGAYDGFSSSQMNGGGGHFASPSQNTMAQYGGGAGSGGKGAGVKRDPQTLVPVTVKQILECQDIGGKFHIDGRAVSQVVVRANVLSFAQSETHSSIQVEDGTGTVTVKMYSDSQAEAPQLKEGEYRSFVGKLVRVGGTPGMTAFAALPVEDSNQLTVHLLDVILAHKKATGARKVEPGAAAAAQQPGMRAGQPAYGAAAAAGGFKAEYGGGEVPMQMGGNLSEMSVRDQVLHAFATGPDAGSDGGCSVQSVVSALSHLSFGQVQEAIQQLSNDGHLYSTIDEEHYKTTTQ